MELTREKIHNLIKPCKIKQNNNINNNSAIIYRSNANQEQNVYCKPWNQIQTKQKKMQENETLRKDTET